MPSADQIKQNLLDVDNAIAQQRLEGLTPSAELVNDLQRAAQGEISISEVIANIGKRYGEGW